MTAGCLIEQPHPYRRESKFEFRIYQPRVGNFPNASDAKFIGKQVKVYWREPVFKKVGWDKHGDPIHELSQWFGYVVELYRQVHCDELHPLPKKEAAK